MNAHIRRKNGIQLHHTYTYTSQKLGKFYIFQDIFHEVYMLLQLSEDGLDTSVEIRAPNHVLPNN